MTATIWLYADHQGSIVAAAGQTGAVSTIHSYGPFGQPDRADGLGFRYTGQQLLPSLGLYYYKARMYSSGLGRFLQPDPTGYADGLNLYAYVGNDPVNLTDPSGMTMRGTRQLAGNMANGFNGVGNGAGSIGHEIGQAASGLYHVAQTKPLVSGMTAPLTDEVLNRFGAGAVKNISKGVFRSVDKHVADVANAIEKAYPGHVVGVNVPIRNAAGNLVTDADILLKNAVIQVKSGGGKGMTSQLLRTEQATGLPTIGYGPNLKGSILKNSTSTNDLQLLIDAVKP